MTLYSDMEDQEKFYFMYPQDENEDWNYARNRSFALKKADACWSSSLNSVDLRGSLVPNRDHPGQGLVCKVDGEYRKFIDGIGIRLFRNGDRVDLEPTKVRVSPWDVIHYYSCDEISLKVVRYLAFGSNGKAGGRLEFELDSEKEGDFEIVASPIVDIRNINSSSPGKGVYSVGSSDGTVSIENSKGKIIFGYEDSYERVMETIDQEYKLGNGRRYMDGDEVYFEGINKAPVIAFDINFGIENDGNKELGIVFGTEVDKKDLDRVLGKDKWEEVDSCKEILKGFDFDDNTLYGRFMSVRVLSLGRFGITEKGIEIPEAGEWELKDIHFPDLFESLYHNTEFYRKVKDKDWIRKVFRWGRMYIKDGLMPERFGRRSGDIEYSSQYATFMYLLSMARFYEVSDDRDFKDKVEETFRSVLSGFDSLEEVVESGTELSWLGSTAGGNERVPDSWDVSSDRFLLPEINALWIKSLEKYNEICGGDVDIDSIFNEYMETFWNEDRNFPFQIVYKDGKEEMKDDTVTSLGVVSASILSDHIFGDKLLGVWKTVKDELLVDRRPVFFDKRDMPFGILTRNGDGEIYMGDRRYNSASVCLRNLPYLFELLRKIGKDRIVKNIGKNILDHQMGEGVIFYNHGIFSIPGGENPSRTRSFENPIPLENPIRLWSHFLF